MQIAGECVSQGQGYRRPYVVALEPQRVHPAAESMGRGRSREGGRNTRDVGERRGQRQVPTVLHLQPAIVLHANKGCTQNVLRACMPNHTATSFDAHLQPAASCLPTKTAPSLQSGVGWSRLQFRFAMAQHDLNTCAAAETPGSLQPGRGLCATQEATAHGAPRPRALA
jgi:hypothetical protein